jgi:hypothetical protein
MAPVIVLLLMRITLLDALRDRLHLSARGCDLGLARYGRTELHAEAGQIGIGYAHQAFLPAHDDPAMPITKAGAATGYAMPRIEVW